MVGSVIDPQVVDDCRGRGLGCSQRVSFVTRGAAAVKHPTSDHPRWLAVRLSVIEVAETMTTAGTSYSGNDTDQKCLSTQQ